MTIPITGQPRLPSLARPDDFNSDAQNIIAFITGSMLDQFNDVDPADFFSVQSGQQDTTVDRLMKVGAFGLGAQCPDLGNLNTLAYTTLFRVTASATGAPTTDAGFGLHLNRDANTAKQFVFGSGRRLFTRSRDSGAWGSWYRVMEVPVSLADGDLFSYQSGDFARIAQGAVGTALVAGSPLPEYGVTPAPRPNTGFSSWTPIGAETQLFLPSGGTWAWFAIQADGTGNVISQFGGVGAGAASVAGPSGGKTFRGFAWRIT